LKPFLEIVIVARLCLQEFIFCENRLAVSREEERGHTGFVEM
jgi:hypothetical protein